MDQPSLLFDTTALIDLYRGKSGVQHLFDEVLGGDLKAYISVVTEAELWRGLRPGEVERHEAFLSVFEPLALESAAARQAGAWMQLYQPKGLGWMDALIVSTATHWNQKILTRDLRLAQCLAREAEFQTYSRD